MSSNQNWNAQLYDGKHKFVSNYGNELIDLLKPEEGEVILDLGCGTGDLTQKISDSEAQVIGIDASGDMVSKAREKYPQLDFKVMDALDLNFNIKFDAVFSNAVLHWILAPRMVLESIHGVLNENGRVIVEFGGKGNCSRITDCIIDNMKLLGYAYNTEEFPWYFPTIGQYASLMEEVGFEVNYAAHFDRFTRLEGDDGLRNWLDMFVLNLLKKVEGEDRRIIIDRVCEEMKDQLYVDGSWHVDYRRIRVVARKTC